MLEYTECGFVAVIQIAPSSLWLGFDFFFYLQKATIHTIIGMPLEIIISLSVY